MAKQKIEVEVTLALYGAGEEDGNKDTDHVVALSVYIIDSQARGVKEKCIPKAYLNKKEKGFGACKESYENFIFVDKICEAVYKKNYENYKI